MAIFGCIYAHAIYLILQHFYKKFGSMKAVIWESPKFTTVDKTANHRRELFQHMDQYFNHIHIHIRQGMPQSQEFQEIAIPWHTYVYSSGINI